MGFPIIDGLIRSEWKHHKKTLIEVGLTAVVSFFPLIASAITVLLISNNEIGLFESLAEVVSRGELVVYASSIIAPVFYLCLRDPPVMEKISQFAMAFMIILLCSVMYTLNYSGVVNNFETLVNWSYWLILSAIFVWYISTLFREMTYNPDFKKSEMDFTALYAAHKQGGME